jgi:hypothetical protein
METKRSSQVNKSRSTNLNDAYWAWLTEVARDANNRGITVSEFFDRIKSFDAIPDKDFLHRTYAKEIIKKQFGKESSSHCTNQELQQVIDQLTVIFAEGVDNEIPFDPEMHNILARYKDEEKYLN